MARITRLRSRRLRWKVALPAIGLIIAGGAAAATTWPHTWWWLVVVMAAISITTPLVLTTVTQVSKEQAEIAQISSGPDPRSPDRGLLLYFAAVRATKIADREIATGL